MKKLGLILLLLFPHLALAQFTNVTATITDSDSQTWNNGKYTATLINPRPQTPASINGTPLTNSQMNISGTMDGSGVISGSFASNSVVVPAGTYWSFTLCPNASVQCSVTSVTISGASQDLSSSLSAGTTRVRFAVGPYSFGYADAEVTPAPNPGGSYYNVTSSCTRVWSGSAWACISGGGSSLPTATSAGQIISSTAAGSTYSVQGQVFYSKSGDTLSSIESECSSACTYIVTSPATITLGSNHTLSSNVNLVFLAGGQWTVTGGTLTIPNMVSGTLSQHFVSNISFGTMQKLVPVEWFGAIGGASLPATDSTPYVQLAINSLATSANGQIEYQGQYYLQSSVITFPSGVGLKGVKQNTQIWTDSATADQIHIGSASSHYSNGVFEGFQLWATVPRTGTSTGVYMNNTDGVTLRDCGAGQSVYAFHIHQSSDASNGVIENCLAQFSVAGTVARVGWFLDSNDGQANASLYMINDGTLVTANPDGAVIIGRLIQGSHINDLMSINNGSAATTTALKIDYTGTPSAGDAASDIHIIADIDDVCISSCVVINNLPTSGIAGGNVEIAGGYFFTQTDCKTNIDIESSFGVTVHDADIFAPTHNGCSAGVFINSSSNISISHNQMLNVVGTAIWIQGTSNSSIIGNIINGNSSFPGDLLYQAGTSTGNIISGNVFSGGDSINTTGIEITSGNATGLETNSFDPVTIVTKCKFFTGPCPIILPRAPVTVASLPAASNYPAGAIVTVSDWNGTNGVCTGGGSNRTTAVSDGTTNWYCP